MSSRLAVSVAILSGVGLMVWLASEAADRGEDGPEGLPATVDPLEPGTAGEGSAVPCDVPLAWRVAHVDGEFGLSTGEVEDAIREAARLWEEAVGRPLLQHHSADGFPIRLTYDERQERTDERRRLVERFEREERDLRRRFEGLEARRDRLQARREAHEEGVRALEEEVAAFREEVATWNERGGAPSGVAEELEERREELEVARDSLARAGDDLDASWQELVEERGRLDTRLEEHAREAGELERAFPPERVRSGGYNETVTADRGEVVGVEREISIHRFEDRRDLVRVAAHELGHALGLGHADSEGALMAPEYDQEDVSSGPPSVAPEDVELFRETCPHLGGAGGP